jgi:hypothetical protein
VHCHRNLVTVTPTASGHILKPSATGAFCKKEGFAESILFAREAVTTARILDSGAMYEGGA